MAVVLPPRSKEPPGFGRAINIQRFQRRIEGQDGKACASSRHRSQTVSRATKRDRKQDEWKSGDLTVEGSRERRLCLFYLESSAVGSSEHWGKVNILVAGCDRGLDSRRPARDYHFSGEGPDCLINLSEGCWIRRNSRLLRARCTNRGKRRMERQKPLVLGCAALSWAGRQQRSVSFARNRDPNHTPLGVGCEKVDHCGLRPLLRTSLNFRAIQSDDPWPWTIGE